MKIYMTLALLALGTTTATAQSLTTVPASAFTGPINGRPGFGVGQGSYRPYDTTANLALAGGLVQQAVAKDLIGGGSASVIHDEPYINDGFYGNGTSWIGETTNSWLKIDFGQSVTFDRVWFGRDRTGTYDDRDPGQFLIQVAGSDVYANGNDANDTNEYITVFDSASLAYSGVINGTQTLQAQFAAPVSARYIKMTFVNSGAAIDEVQVFNGPPAVVPEPSALALLLLPVIGFVVSRARK